MWSDTAEAQQVNERRAKSHTGGVVACVTDWRVISPGWVYGRCENGRMVLDWWHAVLRAGLVC